MPLGSLSYLLLSQGLRMCGLPCCDFEVQTLAHIVVQHFPCMAVDQSGTEAVSMYVTYTFVDEP